MTNNTTELAEWLLGCIDEEAAIAAAATAGPWAHDPDKVWGTSLFGTTIEEEYVGAHGLGIALTGPAGDPQSVADARHIAHQHPARVLARCAAHRKIVTASPPPATSKAATLAEPGWRELHLLTLQLLALLYADRPGYREEWRP